jgi:putative N6-adenine-specific DNA methylase
MRDLFVTCPHGFEDLLQDELKSLGVEKVFPMFCGVYVPKTMENIFLVNYESRIATRVLWPIAEFTCSGKEDLYANVRKIKWDVFLSPKQTIAIDANVQHPTLTNSLFAALVVKDGICDFFRDKTGVRPCVDTQNPDLQLNLFIQKGKATLYLDTSGAPLHKRGWRTDQTEASLHESLAAALLMLTEYCPEKNILCDPFCGSGTFLIEAAWIATKTPPGFLRKRWGFFNIPEFQMTAWKEWKKIRDERRIPLPKGKIFGSDKSRETIDICKKNLLKAGVPEVELSFDEVAYYKPKVKPDFVITNPPYGKRLETSDLLLKQLETFLDTYLEPKGEFYILCPAEASMDFFKRKSQAEFSFKNGGLPVKFVSLQ